MRFFDFSRPSQRFGGSHKKTYKKQRHDKKKPCHDSKSTGYFSFLRKTFSGLWTKPLYLLCLATRFLARLRALLLLESCRSSISVFLTPSVKGPSLQVSTYVLTISTLTQYSGVDYTWGSTEPYPSH